MKHRKNVRTYFLITIKRPYLLALFIALVSAIPYIVSLSNGFVEFDDPALLYANPLVTNFDLVKVFTTKNAEDYLPLVTTSFAIENYFFGLDPFYYHATNLILHLFNSVLVFLLLIAIFPEYIIVAFLSALMFGVHPLHVESVAWVSQRKDMLCTFFSLISMLFYFRTDQKNRIFYVLSIFCFVLALFSKFMAITMPVLIVLIGLYKKESVKKLLLKSIPYIIAMVIFATIHMQLHNSPGAKQIHPVFNFGWINKCSKCTGILCRKNDNSDWFKCFLRENCSNSVAA